MHIYLKKVSRGANPAWKKKPPGGKDLNDENVHKGVVCIRGSTRVYGLIKTKWLKQKIRKLEIIFPTFPIQP